MPEPDPKNQQFLNFKARVKQELEEENYVSMSDHSSDKALDEKPNNFENDYDHNREEQIK